MGKWTRRGFIASGVVGGAALVVGVAIRPGKQNTKLAPYVTEEGETLVNAWVKIGADNVITAIVPHSEMGQGAQTSLAQMLADEMDADWNQVRFLEAPAEDGYANYAMGKGFILGDMDIPKVLVGTVDGLFQQVVKAMHLQITGGSASVRTTGVYGMRVAGAAAREMLMAAASEQWQLPVSDLKTELSHVIAPNGDQLSYAQLAAAAGEKTPSATPTLKTPDQFKIMGQHKPRLDIPSKVDGSAMFGLDVDVEGMKYASVLGAPVFGATVDTLDAANAMSMPGVVDVVDLGDAIGVVADGYWQAKKALEQVQVTWSATANDTMSSQSYFDQFSADIDNKEADLDLSLGDTVGAIASADRSVAREYQVPLLAHACMEPMNATVSVTEDGCQVWVGTQNPLGTKHAVAEALELEPESVQVTNFFMGGGFGRRAAPDVTIQAARLSAAVNAPVKLIWSREQDTQHDLYRPAVTSKFKAALTAENKVVAWENTYVDKHEPAEAPLIPYAIENQQIGYVDSPTHVPFGPWRSVDHSQHGFFTESFIDELAFEAEADPYEFRRELLSEQPRLRKVLDLAAEKAGWGSPLPEGKGRGISLQQSFGSIVAQVVEISMNGADLSVDKVTVAADAGFAVSPDGFNAQMESGIIYGLTAALYGDVQVAEGRIVQANFDTYPIVRMQDAPEIDVHIINSQEAWGGAGEPGTPGIAPALTAAIFAATGKRIRQLPVQPKLNQLFEV